MILVRHEMTVKRGRRPDFIAVAKALMADSTVPWRMYQPFSGSNDIITIYMEFEDIESYARWLREDVDTPEGQAQLKEWYELTTAKSDQILMQVE